jgi:hypothetical protein
MSALRNKLIRLIVEQTIDELPKYPTEVANSIMDYYEMSDDDLILNLESIIQYYKDNG